MDKMDIPRERTCAAANLRRNFRFVHSFLQCTGNNRAVKRKVSTPESTRLFLGANVVDVKYSIEVWRDKHRCASRTPQYRPGVRKYTSIQVHFRAFTRGDSRHGVCSWVYSWLFSLSLSLSLLFGKDVVTAVARCNDSGSLRKLPITLFYCMQVTERISRSGVLHDLPRKGRERERQTKRERERERGRGRQSAFAKGRNGKKEERGTKRAENESKRADGG